MADDPLFQLAATTLSRLRAAAERTHDAATAIAKAFAESRLTPVQIVEGCELLGVPLNAYAVRALVGALADASAHIPAERLIRAIFEAPLPPPTQTAEPSEAAPSPPEVSALPLAQPQDAEQGREALRRMLVRQTMAAPWATQDAQVAPMFESEQVRPDCARPRTADRNGAAAAAAAEALRSRRGAAGRSTAGLAQTSPTEHFLLQARALNGNWSGYGPPTPRAPPSAPPFALDEPIGPPVPAADAVAAEARAAAAAARRAPPSAPPFATLTASHIEQLRQIEQREARATAVSSSRIGPTFPTMPGTPQVTGAAGCAPSTPRDRGSAPMPRDQLWTDIAPLRPHSRRADGHYRPMTPAGRISQIELG